MNIYFALAIFIIRVKDGAVDVRVRMEYTVVSGGTEHACLMAMDNTGKMYTQLCRDPAFPTGVVFD